MNRYRLGYAGVLAGLLLRDHHQVLSSAVERVAVAKDDLVACGRLYQMSVQVEQSVLAIDLGVADGVPLLSLLAAVAPAEFGQERGA